MLYQKSLKVKIAKYKQIKKSTIDNKNINKLNKYTMILKLEINSYGTNYNCEQNSISNIHWTDNPKKKKQQPEN